jgi:hypothetical protein
VLSALLPQHSSHHDDIYICGYQYFVLLLERDGNGSVTGSPDIITNKLGSLILIDFLMDFDRHYQDLKSQIFY